MEFSFSLGSLLGLLFYLKHRGDMSLKRPLSCNGINGAVSQNMGRFGSFRD
jgi:hypothetical protein